MVKTKIIECTSSGELEEEVNMQLEKLQAGCDYKIKGIKYAVSQETAYCYSSYSAMIIYEE